MRADFCGGQDAQWKLGSTSVIEWLKIRLSGTKCRKKTTCSVDERDSSKLSLTGEKIAGASPRSFSGIFACPRGEQESAAGKEQEKANHVAGAAAKRENATRSQKVFGRYQTFFCLQQRHRTVGWHAWGWDRP